MQLPVLYHEQRLRYSGPKTQGESRPVKLAMSQSAHCLQSLPRPYTVQPYDDNDLPPPPPDLLPSSGSNLSLKTPSAFLPPVGDLGSKLHYAENKLRTLTYASDGAFISEQLAHDVAFSSQIPVGMVSQQSKMLRVSGEGRIPSSDPKARDDKSPPPSSAPGSISSLPHSASTSHLQDGAIVTSKSHSDVAYSGAGSNVPSNVTYSGAGSNVPSNVAYSGAGSNVPSNVAYSGADSNVPSNVTYSGTGSNVPSNVAYSSSVPSGMPQFSHRQHGATYSSPPLEAKYVPYSTNVTGQLVHSAPIAGDSMPKAAHVLQQEGWEPETELSGKLEQLAGMYW